MAVKHSIAIALTVAAAAVFVPGSAWADADSERATLQERYATKEGRFFFHGAATALLRDDFFHSPGYGVDAGYYFNEVVGLELRFFNLHSELTRAARELRDEEAYVPDLRAPDALLTAGTRLSWGYGKVLTLGRFVVHFDPQLLVQGGLTFAERRLVPTATAGIGFLTHWRYGIQVKLDLQASVHFEQRNRGMVPATGFFPVFAIGWSPGAEGRR